MDIFSKIEDKETRIQPEKANPKPATSEKLASIKSNIVEKGNICGYEYILDSTKYDKNYKYFYQANKYGQKSNQAQKRAEKLYEIVTTPFKDVDNPKKYEKQKKTRMKKIQKLLKKGINFEYYFTSRMARIILQEATVEEIKLLYENGLRIGKNAIMYSDAELVYSKEIYFAFMEVNAMMLQHIPTPMLEKLIHTRAGLSITNEVRTAFLSETYFNTPSKTAYDNIQLLVKTGQITLAYGEVLALCRNLERVGFEIIPEVAALREFVTEKINADKEKYANQKQLTSKQQTDDKNKKSENTNSKSEAKDAIDKIFEDAQKATE